MKEKYSQPSEEPRLEITNQDYWYITAPRNLTAIEHGDPEPIGHEKDLTNY